MRGRHSAIARTTCNSACASANSFRKIAGSIRSGLGLVVGDLRVVGDIAYQLVVVDSFTAYGVNMGTHFSLTETANTSSSLDCVGELK
ncbi:hypothetical protein BGV47_20060 [Burkholderia ubonensis]|nr:hypothetical protein BGV47_20060 [Burkholderia ubonensis]OJB27495.1 hypothetical protein BGV55_19395 [Burkholderia ubonensis]